MNEVAPQDRLIRVEITTQAFQEHVGGQQREVPSEQLPPVQANVTLPTGELVNLYHVAPLTVNGKLNPGHTVTMKLTFANNQLEAFQAPDRGLDQGLLPGPDAVGHARRLLRAGTQHRNLSQSGRADLRPARSVLAYHPTRRSGSQPGLSPERVRSVRR